jgi:hypothetical protein
MAGKRSAKANDAAAAHFPVFSNEEYDFSFKRHHWPVGLKSTFPEELIRRIGAAVLSYQAGNSAIDYTYKRYFKDHPYVMDDGSRIDLKISREIKHKMDLLSEAVYQVSSLEPKKGGAFISEWTFLRIPFSIKFLLSCANRGAFFEGTAIARMILEQVAWANAIDHLDDFEVVKRTSATKSIGLLKAEFENVGRLYGWLSMPAHWAYEGHVSAMHFEDGNTFALFATSRFKACSLALTILMTILSIKIFLSMKKSSLDEILRQSDGLAKPSEFPWSTRDGEAVPNLTALKLLPDLHLLTSLASELATHYPEDADILDISDIAISECKESN